MPEAHVQQPVRLIQDKHAQAGQAWLKHAAVLQMVEQPSWCGHLQQHAIMSNDSFCS